MFEERPFYDFADFGLVYLSVHVHTHSHLLPATFEAGMTFRTAAQETFLANEATSVDL